MADRAASALPILVEGGTRVEDDEVNPTIMAVWRRRADGLVSRLGSTKWRRSMCPIPSVGSERGPGCVRASTRC